MKNATEPDVRKILIIQTAFIGDVILMTPLITAAKAAFPLADIDVLVIPAAVNILETNPDVKNIIVYDKHGKDKGLTGFFNKRKKICQNNYDLILVPHRSLRSALLTRFSGASLTVGFHNSAGAFLYRKKVQYIQDIHEVQRNLSLLKAVTINVEEQSPQIYPDKIDRTTVDNIFDNYNQINRDQIVAIAPGSVWETKRWPKESFKELVESLVKNNYLVFLIGGTSDRELCEYIAQKPDDRIINLAGTLSIRQSAELLQRCSCLISNDSAPIHLASAVKIPVIALFGPTIPGFGFTPYKTRSKIIEVDLSCRPCSIHGGHTCPIGTHECMKNISAQLIFDSIQKYKDIDEKTHKNKSQTSGNGSH